jgi:uncharacterized repeat protein (TIGR03803 family)
MRNAQRQSAKHLLCGVISIVVFCAATFIVTTAQTLTTLATFNGTNGANPFSLVVQGTDGNFYGTTQGGGYPNCAANGCGTVFRITPAGVLTTIYSFCSQSNGCSDGSNPQAGVVLGTDGNFYGTTYYGGGPCNCGTVFKITPNGVLTTLHDFGGLDGSDPNAPLVLGADGYFYGTTNNGGLDNGGSIFKISSTGNFTDLHDFCNNSGSCPNGTMPVGLVQGTDGNFYGVVDNFYVPNCEIDCGLIYQMTPSGTVTTLYTFCSLANCADGYSPSYGLVQGTDGNFYGTTGAGGANNKGTFFEITSNGVLTTIHSFNGSDASASIGPLIQATDGNFYGTGGGGINNQGTIFKITPGGTPTTLYEFCSVMIHEQCADGRLPAAGLLQASDGNFYGTTYLGGYNPPPEPSDVGTVFKLTGPTPTALGLVSAAPCRLADTRQSNPIQGGTWQTFVVPQLGGCNIPATAIAYSLNVTVVPRGTLGYLTIWPAERPQPYVSTLNSPDGRVKASAAIVPAGASAAVSVYVTDTTDVVLDINGYFTTPGAGTLQFYPLTPCRVVDTRGADGDLGGPSLQGGHERDFPVLEGDCGLPNTAAAYSMNFTVLPKGPRVRYLTVWPAGSPQPQVSTLNDPTGTNLANAALVPAGTGGAIATYVTDDTDLLIDVDGYFAPAGSGGLSFYALTPCRVLDTRSNGGAFNGEKIIPVQTSPCGPPATAEGYVFNATAIPQGPLYFLTLWPDSQPQPTVSTLNAKDGAITSNMAIVPNVNGKTDAWAQGSTQLILDISGYFAP